MAALAGRLLGRRLHVAGRWARVAQREGKLVPEGWVVFLESPPPRPLYGGAAGGQHDAARGRSGGRTSSASPCRVNGRPPEEMVLDSGASLSLLTESAAARLGVRVVPGATAAARGLHETETPMRLGWVDSVRVGDLTLDGRPGRRPPRRDAHVRDSVARRLPTERRARCPPHEGVRLADRVPREAPLRAAASTRRCVRGSKDQNIFFRRMKPMVRRRSTGALVALPPRHGLGALDGHARGAAQNARGSSPRRRTRSRSRGSASRACRGGRSRT